MQISSKIRLRQKIRILVAICFGVGLSGLLMLMIALPSAAVSVADVPNPQQINSAWVTDMAEMIDLETETQLNQIISELEATDGTEMAVVTVPDTAGSASPKAFATELFNTWGIGKAGEDNGLLFLVSKGDRRTEVETGYGLEGLLPDAKVGNILDTVVTPQFKAGNFSQGILSGTQTMISVLKGEAFVAAASEPVATIPQPIPQPNGANHNGPQPVNQPIFIEQPSSPAWMDKLAWLILLGAIAPAVVAIKRLRKGEIIYKMLPLQIKPVGQPEHHKMASPWLCLWAITWIGKGIKSTNSAVEKEISLWDYSGRYKWNERLAGKYGWLAAHQQNRQLNRKGLSLFVSLFAIAYISQVFPFVELLAFLTVCGWLFYELKESTQANAPWQSVVFSIVKLALLTLFLQLVLLIGGMITLGFLWIASSAFLIASLGTTAGLIHLLRTSSAPIVLCETCDRAMQRLSFADLSLHLERPQQVEMNIGSRACEGWHCETCLPVTGKSAFDESEIRLFFFERKKKGIKTCRTCEAKTLEVTTKVLMAATTSHSGSKLITRQCHCCGQRSEKRVTIPRKSSSSSSSYSSGSSSSGSSSSSSSGGSFGGGSSGGGGAGSSW